MQTNLAGTSKTKRPVSTGRFCFEEEILKSVLIE